MPNIWLILSGSSDRIISSSTILSQHTQLIIIRYSEVEAAALTVVTAILFLMPQHAVSLRRPDHRHNARSAPSAERKVFHNIRIIGIGTQGDCWLVRDVNQGNYLVRKVLDEYRMLGQTPLEVHILNEILPPHHSILRIHYWSFSHRRLELYYDYCTGGSLDQFISTIKPYALSEGFLWHTFLQLAEALEILHYRGSRRVVHRDVKPANILLASPYIPGSGGYPVFKLGDFSLATLDPVTASAGTAIWTGPEPDSTAQNDIWGLGAVIHALAHGVGPVVPLPASAPEYARRRWNTNPYARRPMDLPTKYSNRLNSNMMSCLELDPRARISSRELVRKLRRDKP
ncbi:hypothetical protein N7G274_002867 [Stereocaulon virgatum]|uniref:non-specific serine/threonine protein kinase n=1 Tax=Stereocaulon virgatum TaxID=373712 RepID=A0ABR4AHR8_9LECA